MTWATRKFTLWLTHFSKDSFKIEISSPEQTPVAWTHRVLRILEFASIWLCSSLPCLITRAQPQQDQELDMLLHPVVFLDGGLWHPDYNLVKDFGFYFKWTILPQTQKDLCPNNQTLLCNTLLLPSTERESLGKGEAYRQRKDTD